MIKVHPTAFVHETVVLGPNVEICAEVYIGPYCLIGMPAEWKGREHEDKGVIICQGARLTGLVTVDAGVERQTIVGINSYVMKHSHIGHDAAIADHVTVSCGAKIGGHTEIGHHANIGLNAVIHQRQKIGEGCMIGMGSVVTKDLYCGPFGVYVGNPARFLRENTTHPSYPK